MEKNKPLITIVTVTYNCVSKIEHTIKSVLAQTYSNIEYIIIDGGSKDGTLDIISKYRKDLDNFITEPDNGIFDAMNKALNIAKGSWVNFMNAGDTFVDENAVYDAFIDDRSDYSVVYGCVDGKCEDGHIVHRKCPIPFYAQSRFVKNMGMNHQGVFVNISRFPNIRFNTSYHIAADYDMLQNIYNKGGRFLFVNRTIAIIEVEEGLSANNRSKQRMEEALISGVNIYSSKYLFWTNYMKFRQFLASKIRH